jgi:hypothetical protein
MLYFFYFDTILIFFLVHFFHFFCDKRSVLSSKVHYKSIIFLEFIQKIIMIFIKIYDIIDKLQQTWFKF